MLNAFAPSAEGPVTVVLATFGWRRTVLGWIEHARAAGCTHYRIVCLDDALAGFLGERGEGPRAVALRDALPDAPLPDLDAMDRDTRIQALVRLRVKLCRRLAEAGHDFILSDADAFWLGDPRPWLAAQAGYDLLFSQGTTFPRRHYQRRRFTLCAGFFLCRANARTRGWFERVEALEPLSTDDQVRMNEALARDPCGHWRLERPVPALRTRGAWVRPPLEAVFLACAQRTLRHPVPRVLVNAACRLARIDWILTSPDIIEGRFAEGLRVGVIPMHIVMRGPFRGWGEPLVQHCSDNKLQPAHRDPHAGARDSPL